MLQCVEGMYRNGQVELLERPASVQTARVIVAFLPGGPVDLSERGIGKAEAADLRWRLSAAPDDWDSPEMDVYDEL